MSGITGQKHIEQFELFSKDKELSYFGEDNKPCPNRKGDFAEYYSVTWLWDQGFEVFKNCGSTGAIDIVAVCPKGIAHYFDIKSYATDGTGLPKRTDKQKQWDVKYIHFNPRTRKFRWVDHND